MHGHDGQATSAPPPPKRPGGGTSISTLRGDRSPAWGRTGAADGGTLGELVATPVHRPPVPRPRSDLLIDAAITAAAFGATLYLLAHGLPVAPARHGLNALAVALAAVASVPLLAWRRFPLGVFLVTAAASALLALLGHRPGFAIGPSIALYLLTAGQPLTRRTGAAVLGLFAAWLVATWIGQGAFPASELFHGGLAFATGWFAGERTRLRRERIAELETRAWRAEHAAENERRLAVAEERARIARDLHDSAGHAINVIGVLAGAARLRDDEAKTKRALQTIEEIARETVGELDHILHTLRDDDSARVPAPPGLASLETLVAHHTSSGLAVILQATPPPRPLTGTVDQAAFRILQEALTNAARHGTGTARIEVTFSDTQVELTVVNPISADHAPRTSGGRGLIGMRERATLSGGSFEAGRDRDAFRVHATLPYGSRRA
jgi:signal transduction histidine kinase